MHTWPRSTREGAAAAAAAGSVAPISTVVNDEPDLRQILGSTCHLLFIFYLSIYLFYWWVSWRRHVSKVWVFTFATSHPLHSPQCLYTTPTHNTGELVTSPISPRQHPSLTSLTPTFVARRWFHLHCHGDGTSLFLKTHTYYRFSCRVKDGTVKHVAIAFFFFFLRTHEESSNVILSRGCLCSTSCCCEQCGDVQHSREW